MCHAKSDELSSKASSQTSEYPLGRMLVWKDPDSKQFGIRYKACGLYIWNACLLGFLYLSLGDFSPGGTVLLFLCFLWALCHM